MALKAEGRDVIGLAAGEPDFDTPDNIKEAAIAAIRRGETKYTAVDGIPELKKAICRQVQARERARLQAVADFGRNGRQAGAVQCADGDGQSGRRGGHSGALLGELSRYRDAGRRQAGLRATDARARFQASGRALEKAITPKTKWLILNSPSNPSGAAYTRGRTEEADRRADATIRMSGCCTDDMYEHLVYDDFKFSPPAEVEPRLYERTLTMNGVSKAYCMTGWRIGYGGGPEPLIKAMSKLQSQSTSNPSSIAQWAAVEALNGPQDFIAANNSVFKERRDLVVSMLNQAGPFLPDAAKAPSMCIPPVPGTIGRTAPIGQGDQEGRGFRDRAAGGGRGCRGPWRGLRHVALLPHLLCDRDGGARGRLPAGAAVLCRFALTKRGTGRDVMRDGARLTKRWVLAAAAAVLAALPAAAQSGVNIGTLTCNVSGGVGYIITSAKSMACTFSSPSFPPQHYSGVIRKFGIDIGVYRRGGDDLGGVRPGQHLARRPAGQLWRCLRRGVGGPRARRQCADRRLQRLDRAPAAVDPGSDRAQYRGRRRLARAQGRALRRAISCQGWRLERAWRA